MPLPSPREVLTDKRLKALKPAPPGRRYDLKDGIVPGFGVRVTDRGLKTFTLTARFPGGRKRSADTINPTRRSLGEYGAITLEQAREKARGWHALIKAGIDPKEEEERLRQNEAQRRANTFEAVAEDFIAEKLPGERKGSEVERDIRREFIAAWKRRPVTDITDLDVLAIIKAKRKTAPAQARNLLGIAKRFFAWVVDQRVYGLTASPCESLRPAKIIGEKRRADRILSDPEMFALWRAAMRIGYPYGPVYQILMLTALRLNEVADASWSEFDISSAVWVVPAARMKGKNGKARPHSVPLTDEMLAIVQGLPRFTGRGAGLHLFTTTKGVKPVWMSDKIKKQIDARMVRTIRALARRDGSERSDVDLPRWTNHDIRRTVRSNLSRLRVTEEAREAVLAHVRPGIKGTYDHHDYIDEKREALELWGARLRFLTSRTPENVVSFRGAA